MKGSFFNSEIVLLFLGGVFSLLLPVIIIIGKQGFKRQSKREELERIENIGDIEQWLDDSFEFKKANFLQLMTEWSLQPLFIICITNLIDKTGWIQVTITFSLILLIILHELWVSKRYSTHILYQIFMLLLWVLAFILLNIFS